MIARVLLLAIFAVAAAVGGIDFYLRNSLRIASCAACVFEWYGIAMVALIALLSLAFGAIEALRRVLSVVIALIALAGIAVAGREVWLRYYPRKGWNCGADLDGLLQILPGAEQTSKLFGARDCARAHWHFLGLASDEWSLAGFAIVGVLALLAARR